MFSIYHVPIVTCVILKKKIINYELSINLILFVQRNVLVGKKGRMKYYFEFIVL